MVTLARDTKPAAEAVEMAILARMPVWRKVELATRLNHSADQLACVGIRRRHPEATLQEVQQRLIAIKLGAHLSEQVLHAVCNYSQRSSIVDDSLSVTLAVTQVLDALSIPYFIGGSLASIVYGEYRTTRDTDIVATITAAHAQPFVAALEAEFYVQLTDILSAIADAATYAHDPAFRAAFNLIHLGTGFKVDIFVPTPRPFIVAQFQRRVYETLVLEPEQAAFVASPEDTVLAKLEAGTVGAQQWRDVLALLKVQGERLDLDYLRDWAVELGVADLLARAAADAWG